MKSILVIDDDVISRTVLQRSLSKAGYAVSVADDGEEGIKLCESKPVHLVITDVFMPGQSGFEVIQTLQAKDPNLKIIAMSGSFMAKSDQDRTLRETLGILKTFSKPLDPDTLIDFINKVLQ